MSKNSANWSDAGSSAKRQWWLAADKRATGPFAWDQVADQIRSGQCRRSSMICPVGGDTWRPVGESPEFVGLFANPGPTGPIIDPLFSSELPWMANVICAYCLVASPILCILGFFMSLATFPNFREGSDLFVMDCILHLAGFCIGLSTTAALAWGGFKLRSLRRVGAMTILITIMLNLICGVLVIAFTIVAVIAVGGNGDQSAPQTPLQEVISAISILVSIVDLAVEIWIAIWLVLNLNKIQWKRA